MNPDCVVRRVILAAALAYSLSSTAETEPLASFEVLVGGQWQLGNSIQTFEWAPGKKAVIARSFRDTNEMRKVVSHGIWYWHPERKKILGKAVASAMPAELFEYETEVRNGIFRHQLVTFSESGESTTYVETWRMLGSNCYLWQLLLPRPDSTEVVMSGTFKRVGTDECDEVSE